ncbi:YGR038C-B-like protein [Saccharomyces cerevisiae x Saccharomyces kudriavzevii VIN7]|uniref:YGR038C-B-like protein n=1 Tax=Saccharomyces cerevisiae x Saccharomyces kudriavzevii (strain VIN7) TaxID=1095631 RepID=H0GRI7_SACCK|nr:YGR038C-B-like protein [Saccharomyces cerevisiae x Saccharomyces kudriavzevii VIN7]
METQQLSQDSNNHYGCACASVTSRGVQDPLVAPAFQLQESDEDSNKVKSQLTTTPGSSAVPDNHPRAFPQPASHSQHSMMTPSQTTTFGRTFYGHPSTMPYSPYQMSPMYFPSGTQALILQYPPSFGSPLNAPSPESDTTLTYNPVRAPPILTSAKDFLNWVRFYIKFLQNSNLGDILPSATEKAVRQMTNEEHAFLYNTFRVFAPLQFLPIWVKEILYNDYTDIMKIISKSMERMQFDTQEVTDLMALTTLKYNGSTRVDTFETTVTNIIERLNNSGININDKVACQLILKGLSGEYKYVLSMSHCRKNRAASDLFSDIHAVYDNQQYSKQSELTCTKNRSHCKNASRSTSTTPNTNVVTRSSRTTNTSKSRKTKARNSARSRSDPSANDVSADVPSVQIIHLNNTIGIKLRPAEPEMNHNDPSNDELPDHFLIDSVASQTVTRNDSTIKEHTQTSLSFDSSDVWPRKCSNHSRIF